MAFKIFPCGADKQPLIRGWQEHATDNPEQHRLWGEVFRDRLAYWGIPTGPVNDLLVLDVDVKKANGFETIKSNHLQVPQTRFQRTRSGGAHYFFRYPRDGSQYGNRVNFMPGLDLRGAGGYVCHYEDNVSPLAEAPEWVIRPAVKVATSPQGDIYKLAPEIAIGKVTASLENIREAPQGESNNILNVEAFKLGQLVASGSIGYDYAFASLMKAATDRGKPSAEAKATIASGLDGGMKKPLTSPFDAASSPLSEQPPARERWTPPKLTYQNLLDISKLRKPQLFKDWSSEDIHITTADGGTGKTTLKLVEAICLALGQPFLGFDCKQRGKTLFITGEDTQEKLAAMLGQIIREMGLLAEGVGHKEKVQLILDSIMIKKDSDLCLITKTRAGFLIPNADAEKKVGEAIEDFQPKMIVFDPIASFWGSESAVNDMAKAVSKFAGNIVERHHVCLEFINHMGKASSQAKDMSQFAGRGGTGLPSHSRVSRVLRAVDEEEYMQLTNEAMPEDTSAMLCQVNKFSDGSPLFNKPFLIMRKGWTFTRKNLSKKAQIDAEKDESDQSKVFMYIKEQILKGNLINRSLVTAHFAAAPENQKMSRERVKNALQLLQYHGYMGEKLKQVQGPDATETEKVFTILDANGEEN